MTDLRPELEKGRPHTEAELDALNNRRLRSRDPVDRALRDKVREAYAAYEAATRWYDNGDDYVDEAALARELEARGWVYIR